MFRGSRAKRRLAPVIGRNADLAAALIVIAGQSLDRDRDLGDGLAAVAGGSAGGAGFAVAELGGGDRPGLALVAGVDFEACDRPLGTRLGEPVGLQSVLLGADELALGERGL